MSKEFCLKRVMETGYLEHVKKSIDPGDLPSKPDEAMVLPKAVCEDPHCDRECEISAIVENETVKLSTVCRNPCQDEITRQG